MLKRVDEAVIRISKDVIDGKFRGGQMVSLGLKENGLGLPDTPRRT
jgi:basic membrane protein A and related proteins